MKDRRVPTLTLPRWKSCRVKARLYSLANKRVSKGDHAKPILSFGSSNWQSNIYGCRLCFMQLHRVAASRKSSGPISGNEGPEGVGPWSLAQGLEILISDSLRGWDGQNPWLQGSRRPVSFLLLWTDKRTRTPRCQANRNTSNVNHQKYGLVPGYLYTENHPWSQTPVTLFYQYVRSSLTSSPIFTPASRTRLLTYYSPPEQRSSSSGPCF